jgi:hypothetical protein
VRSYIGHWHEEVPTDVRSTELDHDCPTRGPANRYRFAVFLEKEGFYPLLEAAQIAERYDIAIMITKGMSVTAARKLVDEMSQHGVTVLVCHDFDKSGFSILHTLRTDTRRSTSHPRPTVVDLGSGSIASASRPSVLVYTSLSPAKIMGHAGSYGTMTTSLGGCTASRNRLPARNVGVWRAAMMMACPVRG